jgi:hypothetical protein
MTEHQRHELSALFGDMPSDDFAKLVADVQRHGLIEPITLYGGEVVDGWHRYRACLQAGVAPRFVELSGDDRKALAFVVGKNARRRHLTEAAQVGIAKRVLGWHEARATQGGSHNKVSRDTLVLAGDVAEAGGVSVATVKRHSFVEQKAPHLLPAVERGEIGLKTAVAAIRNTEPEVLAEATTEQISALAAAHGDRLDVRIKRMLAAARDLREQWAVVSKVGSDEAISACAEVRFVLGGQLFASVTAAEVVR